MKLSEYVGSRDNNFNLIRILAALAVVVSHGYVLASGLEYSEPVSKLLGMTLGTIAVDIFFISSGFLVAASLISRRSTVEFVCARALRIYPALWVMLILTVFGLGACLTTLPKAAYFGSHETLLYLAKCGTLIAGVDRRLPGVFTHNPYNDTVNGSLWTMPYEVRMYVRLALVWILLRLTGKYRMTLFKMAIPAIAAYAGIRLALNHSDDPFRAEALRLLFMFFTGSTFYVFKERIVLSRRIAVLLTLALLAATMRVDIFKVVYDLTLAYLLFFLAYVPAGWVRNYNRLGDYSYGTYIYAFPIQQALVALVPGITTGALILVSFVVTEIFAVLSWHFLEHRALQVKGQVAQALKLFVHRILPSKAAAQPAPTSISRK